MAQDVKQFVKNCVICQKFSVSTSAPTKPVTPIQTTHPKELLCIDIVGPLPPCGSKKFIIVAIDHYSKYAFAKPINRATHREIIPFLRHVFQRYGSWTALSTDNATTFTGINFNQFLQKYSFEHRYSSPVCLIMV